MYRFLVPLLESRETVDATWDRFFQALSIYPDLDDDLVGHSWFLLTTYFLARVEEAVQSDDVANAVIFRRSLGGAD